MADKHRAASRRTFLQSTTSATGGLLLAGFFDGVATSHAIELTRHRGYGPLRPVRDELSGLPLLMLPEGFRYISQGWTGEQLEGGFRTPPAHDGMAVIAQNGAELTLCRNHEVSGFGQPFGDSESVYDSAGPGGCVNLIFDTERERFVRAWPSLVGTLRNCAGGPTPWETWLSCEETTLGPEDAEQDSEESYQQSHGWVFEVPAEGISTAQPIKGMGRFVHEAVAVDPRTHIVYETEDRSTAGFYRFVPADKDNLHAGGTLQMLRAAGAGDLRGAQGKGVTYDVSWVDIEDPEKPHGDEEKDNLGVYHQGKQQGATTFARLEGIWQAERSVYIVSTNGGGAQSGQIWEYRPDEETLSLVFESPDPKLLKMPDNLVMSNRDGMVICEDSDALPERLMGLAPGGTPFPLAANNIHLSGERGYRGDFRDREWAGAAFSPDGKWLFANIQDPGITFAITGPWEAGPL